MAIYVGGCLCGAVRFEARGVPTSVSTCHCRSCQQAAGAGSVAWAEFPVAAVRWSGVGAARFQSSTNVERGFCSRCGSSLSYQARADLIDLVLASFDDPEALSPDKEIWLDHRLSWNARNSDIPGFAEFE